METLKKQTNIRGDVKVTANLRGDVKETEIFVETLKKQTNIRGEVKVTHKYSRRRGKTDKYWWRR